MINPRYVLHRETDRATVNHHSRRGLLLFSLLLLALPILPQNARLLGQSSVHVVRTAPGLTASDSARALERLQSDLSSIVSGITKDKVGIKVVSLSNSKTYYALNSSRPLTPASTTKLFTTYSALLLFGADYRIPTIFYGAEKPENGVLKGNLYVRGHGDPLLTLSDIDELIAKLRKEGITKVEGDIIGDGTYYDAIYERVDYSGDDDEVENLPPVAGLSIENNIVTVIVSSPREAGQLCNVQTIPASSGFTIINSAKSSGGGSRKRSKGRRSSLETPVDEHRPAAVIGQFGDQEYREGDLPGSTTEYLAYGGGRVEDAGAGVSMRMSVDRDGRQVITVSGTLGVNQTVSRQFEIADPALVVAGMVYDRLRSRGITIGGNIRTGSTPNESVALAEFSRPLVNVLKPVMKDSHNHYAEFVFKMIGAATAPEGGVNTAQSSRAAVRQCMEASNAPFSECLLNDGSGLSRRNLVCPDAMVAVLVAARRNPLIGNALFNVMSIAGVDGTLRKRMKGTNAEGNVHGKTGTLRNVSALTGYVTTRDGEMLAFSMLMNGFNIGGYKDVQNKVAIRLADFSYTSSVQQ